MSKFLYSTVHSYLKGNNLRDFNIFILIHKSFMHQLFEIYNNSCGCIAKCQNKSRRDTWKQLFKKQKRMFRHY